MPKVLVLYYSSYGHIETLANAIAEGARETGATVDVKRVPETAPLEIAQAAHFKLDQAAPVATIERLKDYDAIIVGTGTRFGMTIVGLDYGFAGQMRNDEVVGGAPYGATTIANGDGSRQPSETELEGARYLGRRVANTAAKLFG